MNFKASSLEKITVYNFFSQELTTKNELNLITNVFKDLDRDGDGELRLEEAMNAFEKFDKDNFELFAKEAQKIFNMINFGSVDSEKNA